MSSSQKQPHVLVISYPAQGHVNPMLQFCKRLVAKGIKATFATTLSFSKTDVYFPKLREVGPKSLSDLVLRLDCPIAIIYDGFLPWALDVTKRFGLIGAALFTQTCAVNSIYYHVNRKLLTLPLTDSVVSVPGLPRLENYETPSFVHKLGLFPAVCDLVFNQFTNIDQADWVFFNSFYKLEEQVLDWMGNLWRVRTIGPSLPSMYLDKRLLDDKDYMVNILNPRGIKCMNWLNGKPKSSVVYLSFGSMTQPGPEQMKEIKCGLTDGGFTFLCVVKSCEEDELFKEFVNGKSKKGLVVTWCPQLEVLAHDSIGCFITHCGLNSIIEAIGLGVPMVAMPQWSDQTTNAKYVEDVWGVGVRAKPDANGLVSCRDLGLCIREVMEGEKGIEIKKNVMKWRDLAKEAIGAGGSSENNIDEFVAELKLQF
ncbi:hypothetical protein M8C21_025823 [Ambrosia artemisiifolia]|uniref:Glycosyltransferase n=1 Tax=Ambrosia artemisiifolia TaxID=4212 RepID=A0AAD5CP82_AMBAR|nr:hypothetical protein M8C21_025823 [Ambrosia artemisiifolia]